MTMNYFPPKDRSDVVNLLQVARWRFSQIAGMADLIILLTPQPARGS